MTAEKHLILSEFAGDMISHAQGLGLSYRECAAGLRATAKLMDILEQRDVPEVELERLAIAMIEVELAGAAGLEPATLGLEIPCSGPTELRPRALDSTASCKLCGIPVSSFNLGAVTIPRGAQSEYICATCAMTVPEVAAQNSGVN